MVIYLSRDISTINEGTEKKFHEIYILNFIYFICCERIGHYDRYFRKSACNSAILARILIEFREKNEIKRSSW